MLIITVFKAPKAVCLDKASYQAPGSLLPSEPLLTEKASSTKTGKKGGGRDEERRGGRRWGVPAPPRPGHRPTSCELPVSSEADTGAALSGDLKMWEPLLGTAYSSGTEKKGHLGEMPSLICSLRVLDHTYK